jgi:hypothetical protein
VPDVEDLPGEYRDWALAIPAIQRAIAAETERKAAQSHP